MNIRIEERYLKEIKTRVEDILFVDSPRDRYL